MIEKPLPLWKSHMAKTRTIFFGVFAITYESIEEFAIFWLKIIKIS